MSRSPCVSVRPRVVPPDDTNIYGCEVNAGYCMGGGDEGNCGTCIAYPQTNGSTVFRFTSFATQQRCETCEAIDAPDGDLPPHVLIEFDEPCLECIPGPRRVIRHRTGIQYTWGPKRIVPKTDPNDPCKKCVPAIMFPNTPVEDWQDCADQNPDAENCDCDTSNPRMPRCACCDTPCGICEECTKIGRRKRCQDICRGLTNHICVGGDPNTGTKGSCACMWVAYNPAGLSMTDAIAGYQMCPKSEPTLKANCGGCECTVTCASNLKLDPETCTCVDQCADCTPNSQSFGALAATNSCQECRQIDPDNFGCVDICVFPAVCDGSGGCYFPTSSLGLSLLP